MNEPRYKHLTNSYVNWLGLESYPLLTFTGCACFIPENAQKPETPEVLIQAVDFEGRTYIRHEDGLSWDLP